MHIRHIATIGFLLLMTFMSLSNNSYAYEVTDKLLVNGILAGSYQYQNVDNDDDLGRGAVPFQLELTYSPSPQDIFAAKFGFAAGNGLNDVTNFNLSPWAADLEDDVKNINGSNRDYLLTTWYMHTFVFNDDNSLGVTGGIIDATDYLDENAYSNDEYTQFMNGALVNGPNAFLPSYDIGGAFQWTINSFLVTGVLMNISENDDGNSFNYYGLQLGYTLKTSMGDGNYRILLGATSKDFFDPTDFTEENRKCLLLSFDQQIGKNYGAWLRIGTQDDKAAVDYKNIYSGGFYISGSLWGRANDNAGIGYAYLNDGNIDIENSYVLETYVRFGLNDFFAVTLDVQYMNDKYYAAEKINGFIYGIRAASEF